MPEPAPRLIDLHIDWLCQYAPETNLFGPKTGDIASIDLRQSEFYMSVTSAAVISLSRDAEDWSRQSDPWRSLGELIARVEAEFSGRILIGPDDAARWRDDSDGLTWAVIGVEGWDFLVRTARDLDHLAGLFERGVDAELGGDSSRHLDIVASELTRPAFVERERPIGALGADHKRAGIEYAAEGIVGAGCTVAARRGAAGEGEGDDGQHSGRNESELYQRNA